MESLWSGDIEWADATCGEVLSGSQSHHRQYHRRYCKTANKWTNRSLPTTTQFCSLLLLYHMLMHTKKERSFAHQTTRAAFLSLVGKSVALAVTGDNSRLTDRT
jgi:hypothetical protein